MANNHFVNYSHNTKDFWESCEETFAHLSIDKWLGSYGKITSYWEKQFAGHVDFQSQNVVEYGIGGGYLGKYLFETKGIKSYTGIDISERSLNKTKENLSNFNNVSLYNTDFDFSVNGGDVFISQACIQHFPSVEYFVNFLKMINKSNFKYVILQYRYSGNTFQVADNPVFSLFTNASFILENLTNFLPIKLLPIEENGYQYLIVCNKSLKDSSECIKVEPEFGFYELNYFRDHYKLKYVLDNYPKVGIRGALKASIKARLRILKSFLKL